MLNKKINNKEGVYYWPLWFSKSLTAQEQNKIKKIIKKVQIAQSLLWQAFNIYDDFLDNEGKASELPKANNYFRYYLKIHYQLQLSSDYYKLLEKTFNALGKANQEELIQKKLQICNNSIIIPKKLPETAPLVLLADKSLVLALGPIALLSFLGYKIKDKKVQSTLRFFKCALAAKQLADDSQDWLSDLKIGLITNANIQILKTAQKTNVELNLKNNLATIYLLFANESAPIIINDLKTLCQQAENLINPGSEDKKTIIFDKLIKPIKDACRKAEEFRDLVLEN